MILRHELGAYQPDLLDRPTLVVGSRADIADPDRLADWDGPTFSAVTGEGLPSLVGQLADLVRAARTAEPEPEPFVVHRPRPEGIVVERLDSGAFVVSGRAVERAVALSDLTDLQALAYAQQRLRSLGVDKALARAGATEGDPVHIGGFTFEYLPD